LKKHCEGCGKQLNHEKETKAYEWFKVSGITIQADCFFFFLTICLHFILHELGFSADRQSPCLYAPFRRPAADHHADDLCGKLQQSFTLRSVKENSFSRRSFFGRVEWTRPVGYTA
jgi:hypothetical protein